MVCNTPVFQLKFRVQTGLKWEERHWLLRKRQRMRDRKRVRSRQRPLPPLMFASSWETSVNRTTRPFAGGDAFKFAVIESIFDFTHAKLMA